MKNSDLTGTHTALITPFSDDAAKIDWQSFESLIAFQLKAKVQGFVACGSTGEAFALTDKEYSEVIKFVVQHSGKLPVIAGATHPSFAESLKLAQLAKDSGAVALLIAPSPYVKPTQDGIYEHFAKIHEVTSLPIIAYNIPGRSCVSITPETVSKLAKDKIIIGVKESSGDLQVALEMLRLAASEINLVSGEDALVLPIMSGGGKGVITACGNLFPEEFVAITDACLKNNYATAERVQLSILPLVRACFMESNPIPVKAGLVAKGIIKSCAVRLPLTRAKEATALKMKELLSL